MKFMFPADGAFSCETLRVAAYTPFDGAGPFRRAPFETLDTAAGRKGLLAGELVQHTVIRTGQQLHLRHCVWHVLSTETIARAA